MNDLSTEISQRRQIVIENIAHGVGTLTAAKNEAYGNSYAEVGAFLCILYPLGMKPEQYTDALLLARIFDKMKRIATRKDAFGESPYRDIAGYGICGALKDSEEVG
jgi:hypothetical protein